MKNAHIHRFHTRAAIAFPGKGETVYLTASEARAIASELYRCARDIENLGFCASEYHGQEIPLSHPFDAHSDTRAAARLRRQGARAIESLGMQGKF